MVRTQALERQGVQAHGQGGDVAEQQACQRNGREAVNESTGSGGRDGYSGLQYASQIVTQHKGTSRNRGAHRQARGGNRR